MAEGGRNAINVSVSGPGARGALTSPGYAWLFGAWRAVIEHEDGVLAEPDRIGEAIDHTREVLEGV